MDLQFSHHGIVGKRALEGLLEMTGGEMHLGDGHFSSFAHRQQGIQGGGKIIGVGGAAMQGEIRVGLHRLHRTGVTAPFIRAIGSPSID